MIGEKIKRESEGIVTVGMKKNRKKNLVICASVLIIAAAICINWVLLSGNSSNIEELPAGGNNGTGDVTDAGNNADTDNVASYFAAVQLNRQQARDEALEVLQMVIASDSAIETSKNEAIESVNRIADEIAAEANIETLVMAKGFEDCVAVISDGSANVVVKTGGLLPSEIAQIMEIVYEQTNISPENIKIIEKY